MKVLESKWKGFKRIDFEFESRQAILVCPKTPVDGNKWLYKTEYFEAFPTFELEMLKRGYYVAHISNKSRLCPAEDTDMRSRFCEFLKTEFSLNEKCFPIGMSCGGMQAVYFAALYIDAPVLNLLSWPLGLGTSQDACPEEFKRDIGISVAQMLNYRNHPIDCKEKLLKSGIPIFMVCGDSDITVPYNENGKVLSNYFKANGGNLTEIVKVGCDHHPHGLKDYTPLFDFVEKYY